MHLVIMSSDTLLSFPLFNFFLMVFLCNFRDIVSVDHLNPNALFVIMNIVSNRNLDLAVDCTLLSIQNNVVKDIVSDFNLTIGINFVHKKVIVKKSSKFAKYVSELICNFRTKVSLELGKNDF